ncbi:DUF1176 domain-containing protein [Pseudaminobacter arsenicus]|uniref:DUF1176 domain-containing protein n=1 Tax=Borborobacter arsenicus TaxID=1851146 RepID=A0A432V7D5_9HYPH|nr:DUF1176 domain-containing protein [Pseudaminobacter arsenicus]RUM98050.1 DUF1176 domain-containing protein [Pseudaminobacter arsenicus]
MKALLAATVSMLLAQSAAAAEPAYLDDRSDAASLVRSLYNAINRQEYSRAWEYFGDVKPAKDFNGFVAGYEQTSEVEVITGDAGVEGAAGSTYFNIPVAILARNKDGSEAVFAGCYTARLVNPQVQEPPFSGLHIEKGVLKPVEGPLAEALPASCGDGPAPAPKDAALEQARAAFVATHTTQCGSLSPGQEDGVTEPDDYTINFHGSHDAESEPERKARLFRFFCAAGAYNEVHVYYLANDAGEVRELHFATPELDIHYEGGNSEGKVEAINVVGYRAVGELLNSSFDETTRTITSHGKWRGTGDAASSGTWLFRDGDFSLVQYDVDASYDGEVNPQTVLDYNTAP